MTTPVHRTMIGVVALAGSLLVPATAAAAVTVPFQIDPAPFGNPNGSFDAPAVRCVAVVGDAPGTATITGGNDGQWGCLLSSEVRWLNLSTGMSGTALLSDGLHGIPARAALPTGTGQIVVVLTSTSGGPITPGAATFAVP